MNAVDLDKNKIKKTILRKQLVLSDKVNDHNNEITENLLKRFLFVFFYSILMQSPYRLTIAI